MSHLCYAGAVNMAPHWAYFLNIETSPNLAARRSLFDLIIIILDYDEPKRSEPDLPARRQRQQRPPQRGGTHALPHRYFKTKVRSFIARHF